MPITRTYMCPECASRIEVVLSSDQWDAPPPSCAACDAHDMRQEFAVPAIGGSLSARAHSIAEDIAANDYNVADMRFQNRQGSVPKVRFKDQSDQQQVSAWATLGDNPLETAISIGRETRLKYGSGLEILQRNLQSGVQPDLLAASKRRAIKVW
jgi:hypothetical protein